MTDGLGQRPAERDPVSTMPGSPARRARCRLRSKEMAVKRPPPSSRRSALVEVDVLGFLARPAWFAQELAIKPSRRWCGGLVPGRHRAARGGVGIGRRLTPEGASACFGGGPYEHPDDLWLGVFFTPLGPEPGRRARVSEAVSALRREGPRSRRSARGKVAPAQIEALSKWGAPPREPLRLSQDHPSADAGG